MVDRVDGREVQQGSSDPIGEFIEQLTPIGYVAGVTITRDTSFVAHVYIVLSPLVGLLTTDKSDPRFQKILDLQEDLRSKLPPNMFDGVSMVTFNELELLRTEWERTGVTELSFLSLQAVRETAGIRGVI